jgi:DNA-binding NarL/FixJ family response regulator
VPLDIFLVDDSPVIYQRLEMLLAGIAGARLLGHVGAADIAVREILALRPEVVVLDLNLARGSGFDVLRQVVPQAPGIDFYVLSNFAHAAYRRMAESLGARGFFDKTQEFQRLIALLAERARTGL